MLLSVCLYKPQINIITEMNRRKSTSKAKLNATSQEEIIEKWKENFMNLLGNSPNVTDKLMKKINYSQQAIKLGQFPEEELYVVMTKKKKAENLQKYYQKYRR